VHVCFKDRKLENKKKSVKQIGKRWKKTKHQIGAKSSELRFVVMRKGAASPELAT
jgi:hypothetical protein